MACPSQLLQGALADAKFTTHHNPACWGCGAEDCERSCTTSDIEPVVVLHPGTGSSRLIEDNYQNSAGVA